MCARVSSKIDKIINFFFFLLRWTANSLSLRHQYYCKSMKLQQEDACFHSISRKPFQAPILVVRLTVLCLVWNAAVYLFRYSVFDLLMISQVCTGVSMGFSIWDIFKEPLCQHLCGIYSSCGCWPSLVIGVCYMQIRDLLLCFVLHKSCSIRLRILDLCTGWPWWLHRLSSFIIVLNSRFNIYSL